jgi:hypothetical protein
MRKISGIAAVALLAASFGLAAQKHQNDAFMQGPENETQLAQEVRHQLLMLPYYSIFSMTCISKWTGPKSRWRVHALPTLPMTFDLTRKTW